MNTRAKLAIVVVLLLLFSVGMWKLSTRDTGPGIAPPADVPETDALPAVGTGVEDPAGETGGETPTVPAGTYSPDFQPPSRRETRMAERRLS